MTLRILDLPYIAFQTLIPVPDTRCYIVSCWDNYGEGFQQLSSRLGICYIHSYQDRDTPNLRHFYSIMVKFTVKGTIHGNIVISWHGYISVYACRTRSMVKD